MHGMLAYGYGAHAGFGSVGLPFGGRDHRHCQTRTIDRTSLEEAEYARAALPPRLAADLRRHVVGPGGSIIGDAMGAVRAYLTALEAGRAHAGYTGEAEQDAYAPGRGRAEEGPRGRKRKAEEEEEDRRSEWTYEQWVDAAALPAERTAGRPRKVSGCSGAPGPTTGGDPPLMTWSAYVAAASLGANEDGGGGPVAAEDEAGQPRAAFQPPALVVPPSNGGGHGPTCAPLDDAPGGGDDIDPPSVPVPGELDDEPAAAARRLGRFILGGDPHGAPAAAGLPPLPERQRLARSRRRRLRARRQVINKLGGNLREIRRRAVADSEVPPGDWTALAGGAPGYAASRPPSPGRDELPRSSAPGLDPALYVAGACRESVREVVAAPPVSDRTPPGAVVARPAGGDKTGKGKRRKKRGKPDGPVARGPSGRKVREVAPTLHGVELPTGTDPESRRQRCLLRNRITAQASRDRKRMAIQEARRARDEREVEIEALRRTLRDENERLMSLESMIDLVRQSMTQEQFTRVTGMSTATGMSAATAAP